MNDIQPYPHYKPSSVEWLGDVPAHWEVVRLGWLLRERGEINQDGEMTHVLSLLRERGVIPYTEKGNIGNKKSDDITRYKVVRPDDIVMNCMNVIIGSVGLSSETGCLSPVYYVLVGRNDDQPRYLNAVFQCPQFHQSLIRIGNGILDHRMRIPMELLKCELLPRPPIAEQAAIVRYLDHADGRIRRSISAKERLIGLLEEQRQAVIHRAVTRGLDPDVRLKPSGVEWLGNVPAHWEVRRLKHAVNMRVSNVDKHIKDSELPVRLCNYVDVYKNDRITESVPFMKATANADEIDRFRLELEDILITKDSEVWNDIGVPALVEYSAKDLICGYHLALLRPLKAVLNGAYLFCSLQSSAIAYQFHIATNGVTRYGLSHHAIKSVLLPLPPLPEQAAIVEYLDRATADIDAAIARARRHVELLREYRTRLIADVVTGKLDVREAAATLSENTEASSMIDETDKCPELERSHDHAD